MGLTTFREYPHDSESNSLDGAPTHLVNTDPPYNVKIEPRSNNAISAGPSLFAGTQHHQKLDVKRHPGKAKATHKKLRAKDRPLANDFVTDEAFDQLLAAWFGNMARVLLPGADLMELDPLYCDVIVQRGENLTGKKADRPVRPHNRRRK